MVRVVHVFLLVVLLGSTSGCAQATLATPTPITITIAGSTEMLPVLTALTEDYNQRMPNVLFSLRGGGSRLGEQWVMNGQVDLAASTLVYGDADVPANLRRIPIGLDGIAVIVNEANPITRLSLAQIRGLYSGRTLRWDSLSDWPEDVLLVSREDGSGTRTLFESRIMGEERVALTAVVMPTSADVLEYVAGHRTAIGYVSSAYLGQAANGQAAVAAEIPGNDQPATGVHALSIEDLQTMGDDVARQQYPLSRPLYLLTARSPSAAVQSFLDFVLDADGQRIVARFHVPIR